MALCEVKLTEIAAREAKSTSRIIFPPRMHSRMDGPTPAIGQTRSGFGLPEKATNQKTGGGRRQKV
ncbi:hypothetical protein [Mesorhizobium sp. M7A.F.Ca.US.008.03.1.1]|uniref:hypothetical protein n=1 Tax=Mesorhizobium sp. M7A.F.Ca.US.008.03.1.1 TaxID=2496742 RepID=UPI000FCBBF17|nr:hypothetical protein [Mesorhizobium sp. M7A.F.Ca.US.008.03.1.1]RUW62941.1 hypothetical protein EOA16_07695 [Mesorhizobium sp. M7A.F.Ca.US.008.03.1.1]